MKREEVKKRVEERTWKAVTQPSKTTVTTPCISQRWPNVWDSLTFVMSGEQYVFRLHSYVSYAKKVQSIVVE
jgi:hypothetical protein